MCSVVWMFMCLWGMHDWVQWYLQWFLLEWYFWKQFLLEVRHRATLHLLQYSGVFTFFTMLAPVVQSYQCRGIALSAKLTKMYWKVVRNPPKKHNNFFIFLITGVWGIFIYHITSTQNLFLDFQCVKLCFLWHCYKNVLRNTKKRKIYVKREEKCESIVDRALCVNSKSWILMFSAHAWVSYAVKQVSYVSLSLLGVRYRWKACEKYNRMALSLAYIVTTQS